ncbi:MAG: 23S rRNA (uracil(1939)-C(5))-methyltransferase RlmD [Candidatus Omnitrophica bacterium]|nr:23S rRNA (uracil(1939)-C(5))-methyltransferase RlmD [Candidatus Omnitrophota bacterium]
MKTCKHFGECGSCKTQDMPYVTQLKGKEQRIKDLISEGNIDTELRPINHYQEYFYRNKMEFTFSNEEDLVCGMYSRLKKKKVFNIEECLIFSPDTEIILGAILKFCKEKKYTAYNKYTYQGFLRNLIVREAKFSGQLMVGVVATSKVDFHRDEFVKVLTALNLKAKLKSIYLITNDSWSDAVVFEKKELLWGDEYIEETLDGFTFNIGIDSFFQVNPVGITQLYRKVKEYASLTGKERVLDLFCGVGTIGIFLAEAAKFVWGVEIHKQIVDAAFINAKKNNIKNISFFAEDARRFLNTQGTFYRDVDLLIINPPRCGLNPKIIRAILRLNPKRIIYSSCNPTTLFTDLKGLKSSYKPDFIEPFDFFPHTHHMECLTFLSKTPHNS